MKTKLKYLTKISLKKKICTKWFVVANIVLALILIGICNIDTIIKSFGGDFDEKKEILVIDNIGCFDELEANFKSSNQYLEDMNDVELVLYDKNINEGKEEVKNDGKELLVIEEDLDNFVKATHYVKDKTDAVTYQVLLASLNNVKRNIALEHYNISHELLALVDAPVNVVRERLDDGEDVDEMMELVMGVIFPSLILPFFMLIMILVQMIGAEVNEEKSTRGMEIIISNVSPKTHFFSKVLAGNIFVLFQGALVLIYGLIGIVIRLFTGANNIASGLNGFVSDMGSQLSNIGVLDKLGYIIPITIVLMLLSFLAYSLIAGILASVTTNMEDFQQLQTPIMIVLVIGYVLGMMAAMFEGSMLIRIISYIPFLSALLTPALMMLGQVSLIDVAISFILLIITIYILIKYGLKVYKVGILNYSSTNLWKKMLKALKSN